MPSFRRPRLRTLAFGSLVLVPLIAGGFVIQSRVGGDSDLVFQEVMKLVNEKFVDTLDASSLYEKAAQGLVHELNDPVHRAVHAQARERVPASDRGSLRRHRHGDR